MSGLDPTDLAATATATPESGSRVQAETLAAGTTLASRYRILRLLGRGGMGAVYAARDTFVDRDVAVKLIAGRRSEVERERLREELRATIDLTHRNIARTHTLEDVDGEVFIVMELVAGGTLAERLGRGRVPVAEALAIVDQLLAALEAAHAHKIVHRDVKPSNIMLGDDGRVVLMDFGLARVDDSEAATHTTSVKGTPAYMAPEVVSGRRADARADLYAVGLILFELVTGDPPFKAATSTELMHKQLHDPIDASRLSPSLAPVIVKLTAKDPAARFASVAEVRSALAAPAPRKRPRWMLPAVAVALALAATGGALSLRHDEAAEPAKPKVVMTAATKELYDRGDALFNAGKYAEAAPLFLQAYDQQPLPQLLYNAAQAYFRLGDYAKARPLYLRAMATGTPNMRHMAEDQIKRIDDATK